MGADHDRQAKPREGWRSAGPAIQYAYIERISPGPRLEVFARPWTPMFPKREGWDVWGNEVECDVDLKAPNVLVTGAHAE